MISSSRRAALRRRPRARRRARSRPSRVIAPASTACASSPLWLACSQSSQKIRHAQQLARPRSPPCRARRRPSGSRAAPARSVPSASRTSWPGVTVTTRSAPSASSTRRRDADAELGGGRLGAAPRSTSKSATSRPRAEERARRRPAVDAGADHGGRSAGRPSVSAASTAAAPVRSAVTAPASSTRLDERPFDASERSDEPASRSAGRARGCPETTSPT